MTVSIARPIGIDANVDKAFDRKYTIIFQVLSDYDAGPLEVLNATGIPTRGTAYAYNSEVDLWSFAQEYSANIVETDLKFNFGTGEEAALKWEVRVNYSNRSNSRQPTPQVDNPLLEPPQISGSFLQSSKPAYTDKDGFALLNTAGEELDPVPTVADDVDTLLISYNTASISLSQRADFIGAVNSASIWGLEPRQARIARWSYAVAYAGNFAYIQNKFEFHISFNQNPSSDVCIGSGFSGKQGWYTVRPNVGMSPLPDIGAAPRRATDDTDVPLASPVKLKCDGTRETGATERFNIYAVEKERNFRSIPGMPPLLPGPFS